MRNAQPLAIGLLSLLTHHAAIAEPIEVFKGAVSISDNVAGFNLDVDNDFFDDLNFGYYGISVNSIFAWDAVLNGGSGISNARFATSMDKNERFVHQQFMVGDTIGPAQINDGLFGALGYEVFFDGTSGGPWLDREPGFVGFSFMGNAGADLHYGYAQVQIDNAKDNGFGFLVLYRVVYESTPNTPIQISDQVGCGDADINDDGVLDFFDISAFLTAFTNMEPIADFTDDGVFDFFDISAFLTEFSAGCP